MVAVRLPGTRTYPGIPRSMAGGGCTYRISRREERQPQEDRWGAGPPAAGSAAPRGHPLAPRSARQRRVSDDDYGAQPDLVVLLLVSAVLD